MTKPSKPKGPAPTRAAKSAGPAAKAAKKSATAAAKTAKAVARSKAAAGGSKRAAAGPRTASGKKMSPGVLAAAEQQAVEGAGLL